MKLENKSVVVTGASSGMGKAIVELFVKEGANVAAVVCRKERLEALAESLKDARGQVVIRKEDVCRQEDVDAMIDLAVASFGRLDVLVNNAGVMAINVHGPFVSMRKAVQVFLKQGDGGKIINVSSVGSMHQMGEPVHGASKAALNAAGRNTVFMYKKEGIRCNVIAPGGINTEISAPMGLLDMDGYSQISSVLGMGPEPGEVTDIANCALFLASDDFRYTSGDIIEVDGGWTSF